MLLKKKMGPVSEDIYKLKHSIKNSRINTPVFLGFPILNPMSFNYLKKNRHCQN